MPASPTTVNRTDDPSSGDDFKVYEDTNTPARIVQAVANDPDVSGRLLTWSVTPGGNATSSVAIKTAAGIVFKIDVIMDPTVVDDRWLMVFDQISVPKNNDDPALRARISGGFASVDLGLYGRELLTGLSVAVSSTPGLLTLPAGAEGYFQVGYV